MTITWDRWLPALRRRTRPPEEAPPTAVPAPTRIGLALGGGFARGLAHIGVLKVFEENGIPVHCIAGVSAGAIVAAAYASGTAPDEIAQAGAAMRFTDVARWTLGRMGIAGSERMERFLRKLLKCYTFDQMRIPLGVIATDVVTGEGIIFRDRGDVILPIRASCSYPGLFQPVRSADRMLVDGAISVEVPALLVRLLGATHVISVHLPMQGDAAMPANMFHVINRCFQILHSRTEITWRQHSDLVIEPDVRGMEWDAFDSAAQLIQAGADAAMQCLPRIRAWLPALTPNSIPA
ncbi:MAG TPA: patatin-like phospholipase family protein [Bryobacteraceae bacterium]|nr:patatin-like phospholipase family protein [Bryobacteraceae bacterium]